MGAAGEKGGQGGKGGGRVIHPHTVGAAGCVEGEVGAGFAGKVKKIKDKVKKWEEEEVMKEKKVEEGVMKEKKEDSEEKVENVKEVAPRAS